MVHLLGTALSYETFTENVVFIARTQQFAV